MCTPLPAGAVAQFTRCEEAPHAASTELLKWIKRRHGVLVDHERLLSANISVFSSLNGLYIWDCWTPRAVCALCLADGTQLQLPHPQPMSLWPGRYVVLLGPAAAVGANVRVSAATLLERRLGMPVVNLGRGGAGPQVHFRHPSCAPCRSAPRLNRGCQVFLGHSWPVLEPILAMSHAIVMVVMSARSSPNSRVTMRSGQMARAGVNMASILGARREGRLQLAARLINESRQAALDDSATIFARVSSAAAGRNRNAPRFIVLWWSRCKLHGAPDCTWPVGIYDAERLVSPARGEHRNDGEFPHLMYASLPRPRDL